MKTMNKVILGQKIKNERKKQGLTQSILAGDKITRNMLSQIENGLATPSLETLEYLAGELNVPLSYLVSEVEDLNFFSKKEVIDKIYRAYRAKSYTTVLNTIASLPFVDDELGYIGTTCAFLYAKECITKGSLLSALKYLNLSKEYSEKTQLDTSHITSIIPMYLAIVRNVQSPLLEFDPDVLQREIDDITDYEFFKYLTLDSTYKYKTNKYRLHIEAKQLIKERNYRSAVARLEEAVQIIRDEGYDAFLMFGIYADLEQCYKHLFDFENAYLYSSKRMSLIEGFKS